MIHAIERGVKLTFKSYERLFPNQDYLPESGLGEPSCFAFAGGASP
ncbi:TOTE conflict system archaeo-eukaryotic primase domain-containing protein [Parabacteroides merdae]